MADETPAPAPVATETPAVAEAPAAADTVDTVETVEADAPPDADSFGWDSWDGSDDALPEHVRPWSSKLNAHHMRLAQAARDEADRIRQVYESLTDGAEHPELVELRTKYDNESKTWKEERDAHQALKADYEAYQKSVSEWHDKQLQEKVDAFREANSWMFENEEIQALGGTLIDEGFDPYTDLPVILRLPEAVRERARSAMKELAGAKNAGQHAIKIARAEVRLPAKNPSAELVSGSESRIANKVTEPAQVGDASLSDITAASLRRNLRAVQ